MITKTADGLPPLGQYVLVHVPDRPWTSPNEEGVYWVSARRVAASPYAQGTHPGDRDYYYQGAGAEVFNGQEVTEWCPLPHREPDERTKIVRYLECQATDYEFDIAGFDSTVAEVIDELAACIRRGEHQAAGRRTGYTQAPVPRRAPDELVEVVSYIRREATKYQGAFVGTAAEAIDEIAACIQRGKHRVASEGNGEG